MTGTAGILLLFFGNIFPILFIFFTKKANDDKEAINELKRNKA